MQTILELIKQAGGWRPSLYLKVDHAPYMELVIEAMAELGPCGLPAVSVAHYGALNGDLMRDPEMCFELSLAGRPHLSVFYFRNDYLRVEQWSRFMRDGKHVIQIPLHREHEDFAELWDRSLAVQGFVNAFDSAKHVRG